MKKIFAIVTLVLAALGAKAQTTNYQVHALFVLNIAKYSEWPAASNEFHIVIFGKSKIYDELLKFATNKNINGLTIRVSQVENISEIGTPELVYVADGKSAGLGDLLKLTDGKSIMVIAEREGLFKKGAGFSFVLTDNNTLRYDINNTELEKRKIRISKNLSTLANSMI